ANKRMSEFLVPKKVSSNYIKKIIVHSNNTKERVEKIVGNTIAVEVNRNFYF
ncbi:DUF4433 domain-containing protein, partial [Sulfurimonas sp. SAG-AH-194-C21]|nr:DUF4433 domain-containing protein [Sulfurimonas sp. SAG-AH-194-C21]